MSRSRMQGLTLVELMIAMVLGLVVIGGAISLTLANRQSYRTNEGLSQLQESARTAFELLGRDVRQAGVTGCDNRIGRIVNTLIDFDTRWWSNSDAGFGLRGYNNGENDPAVASGTADTERVSATDSIQLQGIQGASLPLKAHAMGSYRIDIESAAATGIQQGDVLVVCDFEHSTIFQVSGYNAGTKSVVHDVGVVTPGNSTPGLGRPLGNTAPFEPNANIGRFFATDWYIGRTGPTDGERSLFRRRLDSGGSLVTEEVVSGVVDMQIRYRVGASIEFEPAPLSTADWSNVNAIELTLIVESADTRVSADPGTSSGRLRRTFTQIVTLRNRVP